MQYKIFSVRVKNFKCFDNQKFYEFNLDVDRNPIILTGPNGFGKTTFFDAIELMFSKKITRFEAKIEKGNTNLLKNVLLNIGKKDGFIVISIVNENKEYRTLFAKIDHTVTKVSYGTSIRYGFCAGIIKTEELETFLAEYREWKDTLTDFGELRYSDKNFNVYYYVSQAEAVHFLKNQIYQRKDALNALLDIGEVPNWEKHITEKLIGERNTSSNVLINDSIKVLKQDIDLNVVELKNLLGNQETDESIDYFPLLSGKIKDNGPKWDEKEAKELTVDELKKAEADIERLHHFATSFGDYEATKWNEKIDDNIKTGITDFILCEPFFEKGKINVELLNKFIFEHNTQIELFTQSAFFRAEGIDTTLYKEEQVELLKEKYPDIFAFEIQILTSLCKQIGEKRAHLGTRQKALKKLEDARNTLHTSHEEYDDNKQSCPYCGYIYLDSATLEEAYVTTKKILEDEQSESLKEVNVLITEAEKLIEDTREKIQKNLEELDEEKVRVLIKKISAMNLILKDQKRINELEFIYTLIFTDESWKDINDTEKNLAIQKLCLDRKRPILDPEYARKEKDYSFDLLLKEYPNLNIQEQVNLVDQNKVDQKIKYLRHILFEKVNVVIQSKKTELKEKIIRLHKLEKAREGFDKIVKIYEKSIELYKNQVLEKLRIPLLIYTGKILQDYQNGLGVFISKDEMRFVTNGDVKHDVLNSFSSGQLSGFVLAFLFSMNKRYIKKSEDDIGFLLIDDPVQTMDDINISSMIEVLRNDFKDKQIIISTHESDKENYILYKFYKYGIKGQSFNVKDQLYEITSSRS